MSPYLWIGAGVVVLSWLGCWVLVKASDNREQAQQDWVEEGRGAIRW
jgi:hypothetical protein